MTDFNDTNRNNAPVQPEPAAAGAARTEPQAAPAEAQAPAAETAGAQNAPETAPAEENAAPKLTVDPAEVAARAEAVVAEIEDAEIPPAPEMPVPPVQNTAAQPPYTPPPAPQPPVYQQSYYQPPRYTQQYQPPYNEPQPPYQQPYAPNPYGQQQGYQNPYTAQKVYAQKSRIAAALLGILFGAFGVHNFYQGRIGIGIAQLAITVVSCGWLSVVSVIWGMVEGIQLLQGKKLVDGHGLPFID